MGQNLEVEEEHLKGLTHALKGVLEGVHSHVEQNLKLLVLVVLLQISQGFDHDNGFPADIQEFSDHLWWDQRVCKCCSHTVRDIDLTSSCGQQY
jgi:hypothetical protein